MVVVPLEQLLVHQEGRIARFLWARWFRGVEGHAWSIVRGKRDVWYL